MVHVWPTIRTGIGGFAMRIHSIILAQTTDDSVNAASPLVPTLIQLSMSKYSRPKEGRSSHFLKDTDPGIWFVALSFPARSIIVVLVR